MTEQIKRLNRVVSLHESFKQQFCSNVSGSKFERLFCKVAFVLLWLIFWSILGWDLLFWPLIRQPVMFSNPLTSYLTTTKISHIKVIKPPFTWHHRIIILKKSQLLCFKMGLMHQKLMTLKSWLCQSNWKQENRIRFHDTWLHAHERSRGKSWYFQEP